VSAAIPLLLQNAVDPLSTSIPPGNKRPVELASRTPKDEIEQEHDSLQHTLSRQVSNSIMWANRITRDEAEYLIQGEISGDHRFR
jgi:hypothetical protein